MIMLGIVLLVLGLLFWAPLVWVGVLLIVVGALFWLLASAGRPVGGRRNWY